MLSGIAHQVFQQTKLLWGQLNSSARAMYSSLHVVQFQVCYFKKRLPWLLFTTQHGANSRRKLRERKRLCKIIIGSGVKESYPFRHFVGCRQNQDGNIRICLSHFAKYFAARYHWKVQIKNQQIECVFLYALQRIVAAGSNFGYVVFSFKGFGDERRERSIIFCDQDPHPGLVLLTFEGHLPY